MKKNLLILACCASTFTINSQVSFETQTSGTTQHLKGTTIIPGTTKGWASGAGGTILYTTDGGANWTAQSSGQTATFEDIMWGASGAGGAEYVWACGSSATVVSTSDAGTTWSTLSSGAPFTAFTINFQGIANGVMMGDQFFAVSTNGGNLFSPTMNSNTYYAVDFVGSTGWACGNGGFIKKTTDGGATWTDQVSGTTLALHGIDFINANEGWACGLGGTMLHTTNGGASWTVQTSSTANLLSDVKFADSQNGWACGYTGTVLRTTNGGATWTSHVSGTTAWLQSIALIDGNEGWTVGEVGTIIHFEDAGGSSAQVTELNSLQVSIYPNPTSSQLTIETDEEVQSVIISDLNGQIVQSETNKNFSIEQLKTGMYMIQVTTTNGSTTKRISKI